MSTAVGNLCVLYKHHQLQCQQFFWQGPDGVLVHFFAVLWKEVHLGVLHWMIPICRLLHVR
jgi:hypothetical protein